MGRMGAGHITTDPGLGVGDKLMTRTAVVSDPTPTPDWITGEKNRDCIFNVVSILKRMPEIETLRNRRLEN